MEGRVENWIEAKGFGFLMARDGQSYFCHISALQGYSGRETTAPPRRGAQVLFDVQRSPKTGRTEACRVIVL